MLYEYLDTEQNTNIQIWIYMETCVFRKNHEIEMKVAITKRD